jgi:hypothetical protein
MEIGTRKTKDILILCETYGTRERKSKRDFGGRAM